MIQYHGRRLSQQSEREYALRYEFLREDSDPYLPNQPSSVCESDFEATNRIGDNIPNLMPKRCSSSTRNRAGPQFCDSSKQKQQQPQHSAIASGCKYTIADSDHSHMQRSSMMISSEQRQLRNPSPAFSDYSCSVEGGSNFGNNNRVPPGAGPTKKSSLRPPRESSPSLQTAMLRRVSDHNSVHSDLSDISSINRRVTFGGPPPGGDDRRMYHYPQLKVLSEERGADFPMEIQDKYSVDTDILLTHVEGTIEQLLH